MRLYSGQCCSHPLEVVINEDGSISPSGAPQLFLGEEGFAHELTNASLAADSTCPAAPTTREATILLSSSAAWVVSS